MKKTSLEIIKAAAGLPDISSSIKRIKNLWQWLWKEFSCCSLTRGVDLWPSYMLNSADFRKPLMKTNWLHNPICSPYINTRKLFSILKTRQNYWIMKNCTFAIKTDCFSSRFGDVSTHWELRLQKTGLCCWCNVFRKSRTDSNCVQFKEMFLQWDKKLGKNSARISTCSTGAITDWRVIDLFFNLFESIKSSLHWWV